MHSALRLTRARFTAGICACIPAAMPFAVTLLVAMLLCAPSAIAQSSDTAGLEIYVHDSSGAVVPDA